MVLVNTMIQPLAAAEGVSLYAGVQKQHANAVGTLIYLSGSPLSISNFSMSVFL